MKTESKRKNILVLVAIALFFVACPEDDSSNSDSESGEKKPETNVSVEVASGAGFQGLDEVKDPKTGEDSVTYISMENNQQIELKVTLAQSTEMYQRLLFRTDAPTIFRLGIQSPANADVVELRPGQTTEVYIRSFYNGEDEPRMQTSRMRVIGLNAENEETILREFRVGSYKKVALDLKLMKVKPYASSVSVFDGARFWEIGANAYRDSAEKILAPAIVELNSVQLTEEIVPYDENGNGKYDMVNLEGYAELDAIDNALKTQRHDGEITAVLVDTLRVLFRVLEKTGNNSVKVKVQKDLHFQEGDSLFLGAEESIYDVSRGQFLEVLNENVIDTTEKEIFFKSNVNGDDLNGNVLRFTRKTFLGFARPPVGSADPNIVHQRPIVINSGELNSRMNGFNRDWPVPLHELSHLFGLRDVAEDGNLMICAVNGWETALRRQGAAGLQLRGRAVPVSQTGTTGCPVNTSVMPQLQWDAFVREPIWTW